MVNTSVAITTTTLAGVFWLFAQVSHSGVNWEIIIVGVGLVVTLLGIAWKGGLLAGGQTNRIEAMVARMEALEGELVSAKAEFHAYRGDLQKVRDMAVISHNDVGYIKAFTQELTQSMKSLERELMRVRSTHE